MIDKTPAFFAVFLWTILLVLQTVGQTYINPVIPGDFPDPSVIRVGKDYYATATTGGWAPHYPIMHSRDLVNWKIIGAVFYSKPDWIKSDFWAPEIVQDKGRFFVYYTARRDEGKDKKGTLCVAVATAPKPEGPYIDKGPLVCQEMGSIDADFARDENGKPFLIWKEDGNDRQQPTWLYAQPLDESGTRLLGKPTRLFRNTEPWEGGVVEGAFLVRRDGWFYLFYSGNACCGSSCNYALGVARSKTLLGKWEKNPANPILAENDLWQCPGHGSIVETPDDRSFLLYHAYRKSPLGFQIGREALLDEVKFEDGWATINGGRGPSDSSAVPFGKVKQQSIFANSGDEFNGNRLSAQWSQILNDLNPATVSGGFLKLAPSETHLARQSSGEVFIFEKTVSGDYQATAKIDFDQLKADESAGIAAATWRGNSVGISVGRGKVFIWENRDGEKREISSVDLPEKSKTIQVRMKAEKAADYDFYFSLDEGKSWRKPGETIDGSFVGGSRIALVYKGRSTDPRAKFDWIKVGPN
ncbi:MAG: family 43 glycosylhydrolase [Pyrinomonadaceae bacterium]